MLIKEYFNKSHFLTDRILINKTFQHFLSPAAELNFNQFIIHSINEFLSTSKKNRQTLTGNLIK